MTAALKLRAADAEDVKIISACMQDAVVSFADMQFAPAEKRFLLLANRFRWEKCRNFDAGTAGAGQNVGPCETYERVKTALCFDGVTGVRLSEMDYPEQVGVLELLAITVGRKEAGPDANPGQEVVLIFAGGGTIRLEVGPILCHLEDLGEPWLTQWRPCHPLGDVE